MARVSRKRIALPTDRQAPPRVYNAALYARLSVEDRGGSIELQQALLRRYVQGQPDMREAAVFVDNGATGTNFSRPGFEKLMEAVRQRQVDCIVVKDLSRFGRNYVEAGYYLEQIFPFLGVRFVAVNDAIDTANAGDGVQVAASLKNIVNALFAKDISKKTATALRVKQARGEYLGSWAPYGYQKSPQDKHRLVADPEAAPVVRLIFQWRLQGCGYAPIARRLNDLLIPSPNRLRFLRGARRAKPAGTGAVWQGQTVRLICANPAYTGKTAQGKQVRSFCDGIPPTWQDERDWVIVAGTHEPIISQEVFDRVQALRRQGRRETGPAKAKRKEGAR